MQEQKKGVMVPLCRVTPDPMSPYDLMFRFDKAGRTGISVSKGNPF